VIRRAIRYILEITYNRPYDDATRNAGFSAVETTMPAGAQRRAMATVSAAARLHVGFENLSLAHDRLYGGIGIGLETPRTVVSASPADSVRVEGATDRTAVEQFVRRSVRRLSVSGAHVTVDEEFPRHVGLGSGTQLALSVYAAVARAYGKTPDVRAAAPELGRGGRSGVGVAAFERGGLIVDGGHPTELFTTAPPERGEWTVSPVIARHHLPDDWQFVLVIPNGDRGRHGADEEQSMRSVVTDADPQVADEIAALVVRRLLPGAANGDADAVGDAIEAIGRRNGSWYADEQGGVYRPPVGRLVETLSEAPSVFGAGQSSWGPTTYGLTDAARADRAREAGERALSAADADGEVRIVSPADDGARIDG
jgi:beta-ribofuranosylaminobenzene 5'-phosphate synthase